MAGIGMIHQHFMLVPSQTVTENIILGLSDHASHSQWRTGQEGAGLAGAVRPEGQPKAKIWQLSVGEQQRVEVLKMLYRGAKILIMDEPTAVLTPQEVEELFVTLHSVLPARPFHRLHQPQARRSARHRQPVTVLRHGKVTAPGVTAKGATKTHLAQLMVGHEVVFTVKKKPVQPGRVVLISRGSAPRTTGACQPFAASR